MRRVLRPVPVLALAAIGAIVLSAQAAAADAPPRVDSSFPNAQPPYPESAQLGGERGTVTMDVYVQSSGKPTKVRVSRSSGFEDLDTAAVQGVLNWRFLPAIRNGDTTSDWTTVKVVYDLPAVGPAPTANQSGTP